MLAACKKLAVWTYKNTQKFPGEKIFGLVSKMRKSTITIALNVAKELPEKLIKTNRIFVPFLTAAQ